MNKLFILSLLLQFVMTANAQMPQVGQKAPSLVIGEVIANKVPPDFYKNKYLVLDFWQTWCMPCIASFPYIDSISNTIDHNLVTFALISDEDPAKIRSFFEQRKQFKTGLIKLADENKKKVPGKYFTGTTFSGYHIKSVPQTFIIDPAGYIRWHGYSSELTKELIENIISGKPSIPQTDVQKNPVLKTDSSIINGFAIKSQVMTKPIGNSMINNEGNVYVYFGGMSLNKVLAALFHLKDNQVEVRNMKDNVPVITLTINRNTGAPLDSIALLAANELSKYYKFSFHFEKRNFEGFEILFEKPATLLHNGRPFNTDSTHSGTIINQHKFIYATNQPATSVKDLLSEAYSDLVFTNGGKQAQTLKGKKFDFYFPVNNFNSTISTLKYKYGIWLKRKVISRQVLVIDL